MRHWVECRVAIAVVKGIMERPDSFEWIDQGGDVCCRGSLMLVGSSQCVNVLFMQDCFERSLMTIDGS